MKPKAAPAKTIHGIAGEHMRTVPTNVPDVRGVIPPAGLDPLIADRNILIRHGFPLPPDERRSPGAARIWRQTLNRRLNHIVPAIRERPEQKNGVLADLPEYEHITFYNTVACTATTTNGAQAQPITMVDGTTTLSAGALATSDWDCTFNAAS